MIRAMLRRAAIVLANSIDTKHLQTLIQCHETAKSLSPPFSNREVLRATLEFYFNAVGIEESSIPANISIIFRDSEYQINEQSSPPENFNELCIRTILFERSHEMKGASFDYIESETVRVYRLVAKLLKEPLPEFLKA
jgi:hypothetical protein